MQPNSLAILKDLSFSCPCAYPSNKYQSILFLIGPSLTLFLLLLMLNTLTWRILYGCWARSNDTRHSCAALLARWVEIIAQASIAPAAWIIFAFLDGAYYRCFRASEFCPIKNSVHCVNWTETTSLPYLEISNDGEICPECICNLNGTFQSYLDSQSSIIGWSLLIGYGLLAVFVICLYRICNEYTLLQRKYVEIYKDEEESAFEQVAKEHAAQVADANVRLFFDERKENDDWDWISGVPAIRNKFFETLQLAKEDNSPNNLFTPLQLWAKHKEYQKLSTSEDDKSGMD
ncbi:hypothetical protein PRIPAC_91035 [Pristionchus pacificus]|uniref:Clhm-1 n=1 Tax=Pristionchus pacificus TaxID=54126 RepID=A0A2A6CYR4_PRIPA|nr:hypothetical protein PRIPAC_91035 [Pristionchus pacificus]|eukprot:PDM83315.1 clhm-1 [Pristionchus pacificus]